MPVSYTHLLCLLEFGIGLTAIDTMEKKLNDPGTDKAERKTKEGGEKQTIKNFYPLGRIDAAEVAMQSNRGAGKASDQRVAFKMCIRDR